MIVEQLARFGCEDTSAARLNDTCVREVAPEVEDEKLVSRPRRPNPEKHQKSAALELFIRAGAIKSEDAGFQWAFESLKSTTLKSFPELDEFPKNLRVTNDFATVAESVKVTDEFQQHVKYVLLLKAEHVKKGVPRLAVIISQYEADTFWDMIKDSDYVDMHIYNCKSTLTAAKEKNYITVPMNARDFGYPTDVRIALNIFAGQLYFQTMKEYAQIATFLGLVCWKSDAKIRIAPDSFILPSDRGQVPPAKGRNDFVACTFKSSPVPLLKKFLTNIRNHGATISHTHMGRMLNGEVLSENDFSGGRPKVKNKAVVGPKKRKRGAEDAGTDAKRLKADKKQEKEKAGRDEDTEMS